MVIGWVSKILSRNRLCFVTGSYQSNKIMLIFPIICSRLRFDAKIILGDLVLYSHAIYKTLFVHESGTKSDWGNFILGFSVTIVFIMIDVYIRPGQKLFRPVRNHPLIGQNRLCLDWDKIKA